MMTHAGTARGSLEVAAAHAVRLLAHDAAAAVEQAQEILSVVPADPVAALVAKHGPACRGDAVATVDLLRRLCHEFPTWAVANHALGRAAAAAGRHAEAAAALQRAVDMDPGLADAWRDLADQLDHLGDRKAAAAARRRHIDCPDKNPHLLRAGAALHANRIPEAEALLRPYLKQHPTDVLALRMLAEVAARLERYRDAEELLARCLELVPDFAAARRQYAVVLHRQYKNVAALAHIEALLAANPLEPSCTNLKAAVLGDLGRYDESIQLYEGVLARYPEQSKVWLNYGHALKTVGRREHSIAAYRRCIALTPHCGAAYWSLANLKTFRFTLTEVEHMMAQLARKDLADDDRLHLHFAIGKALEDEEHYSQAFAHYSRANRLRRASLAYDPQRNSARVQRSKQLLTAEFFEQRRDCGSTAPDPIFIVGLPRAGSTLLEQILASHSLVEGTMELPDLIALVGEVRESHAVPTPGAPALKYPQFLSSLTAAQWREVGERYLERTRIHRKTGAPFFIDKMPNNFAYVAFIQLALPNAKIIDARRHPMACCFSIYKQHFARGQEFGYDLGELGRYYADYVELMEHFERVLPGRVHRVDYEQLVEDTEPEVRRLLGYCGLPFEPACLDFHANERPVRTASSEQVRSPIYRSGIDHWHHFEAWLEPLRAALGGALACYSRVPDS